MPPLVLGGPINDDWVEAHAARLPVTKRKPDDSVITNNLSRHHWAPMEKQIEAVAHPPWRFLTRLSTLRPRLQPP